MLSNNDFFCRDWYGDFRVSIQTNLQGSSKG